MLQGGDIVWLAPDFPQASAIWREEIKPRFAALGSAARISESQRRVEIVGLGSLEIRSAEAVDGIRGRKLHGLVVDEAAYQDAEYAWGAVLRPALADHQGWALFASSPNAGADGNQAKRRPSFFNLLCEKVMAGVMGPEWEHFHNRSGDNPKLAREEIKALYAEYPENSPVAQQELDALLIVGGSGVAFPEFKREIHVVPTKAPPKHWRWAASMDWGYRQGAYHLYALGPEGEIEVVWEYYADFKQKHAREAALAIFKASESFPKPEYIAADEQMWSEVGQSMTLAEEFRLGLAKAFNGLDNAPLLQEAVHSAHSRIPKKNLMHRYLGYEDIRDEQGRIKPWHRPRLTIQDRCKETIRTLEHLPLDEKKLEDVDTDSEDHAYDSLCMMLTSRPPLVKEPEKPKHEDQHPGYDYERKRVRTFGEDETEKPYSIPQYTVPR